MLLARHKRKGFLHRIVTGDKKWIHYDNPKKKKWGPPGHASIEPSRIFMEKNLCCVFGGISLVSCIMSCSNRTRPLLGLSTEHNWWDWAEHSRKNAHTTTLGMTKLFSCMIMLDHMLRRRSKPSRNTQMGSSLPPPPRRILQTLLLPTITCSDRWCMACLSSTSHHMKIPKIVSMIG